MVSPGQLVPSALRGHTAPRDRQWSVPVQLVPSSSGGPANQGAQPVPELTVASPVAALAALDRPTVPDPSYGSRAPAWARPTTTQRMSRCSSPSPQAAIRSLALTLLGPHSR